MHIHAHTHVHVCRNRNKSCDRHCCRVCCRIFVCGSLCLCSDHLEGWFPIIMLCVLCLCGLLVFMHASTLNLRSCCALFHRCRRCVSYEISLFCATHPQALYVFHGYDYEFFCARPQTKNTTPRCALNLLLREKHRATSTESVRLHWLRAFVRMFAKHLSNKCNIYLDICALRLCIQPTTFKHSIKSSNIARL